MLSFAVASVLAVLSFAPPTTQMGTVAPRPAAAECDDSGIKFEAPADGAVVSSPLTIEFNSSGECQCDDNDCWQVPLSDLRLEENGNSHPLEAADALEPGVAFGDGSIEVTLPDGENLLTILGESTIATQSASITVTVTADGGTGDGETGDGTDGETGDGPDSGTTSGGTCAIAPSPAPWPSLLLGLGLLGLVRLRRREARPARRI